MQSDSPTFMERWHVDHLANAALCYARKRVQEDTSFAERDRLTYFIKDCIVEFTRMWTTELERQTEVAHKLAHNAIACSLNPPMIVLERPEGKEGK